MVKKTKKTKKPIIVNVDTNEASEEQKIKVVSKKIEEINEAIKMLKNKLQEIYSRSNAMTAKEQKEVEELKKHINELTDK
tara:strand:+ start:256 stop:495 length:240 start_codon:yes stop_codon:yes gene_type:complete